MIEPEALVARSLRSVLLRELPAKCAALDLTRAPVLRAPIPGPYTVPSGAMLRLRLTEGAWTTAELMPGVRTAAQVAADIAMEGFAGVASQDSKGRLTLTGTAPLAPSAHASVELASEAEAGASTGTYAVFGFDDGGNRVVRSPLLAPTYRSVYDGLPVTADFAGSGALSIIIGDRRAKPDGNLRRQMWDVQVDLLLYRADPLSAVHASRDGIQAALAAVRAVLTEHRKLDDLEGEGGGSVMLSQELASEVAGQPLIFDGLPQALFDRARVTLAVRVYAST